MYGRKRKLLLLSIGTLLVLTLLIGFSYSIYTANIHYAKKTNTAITTNVKGTLVYTGQTDIDESGMIAGDKFEKTFTVENLTDHEVNYNIYIQNVHNDYGQDLYYTIYETDENYETKLRTVTRQTVMPENTEGKAYLKTKLPIDAKPKIQYFKMVVEYKYLEDVAQPLLPDYKFEGTVGVDVENVDGNPNTSNKYTLTINPNGGTYNNTSENTVVQLDEGDIYNLEIPTIDGLSFIGWKSSEYGINIENNKLTMPNADVTLTAQWGEAKYVLTINPNGGVYNNSTDNTDIQLSKNEIYNLDIPTKEGYDFNGWTSNVEGILSDNIVTMPNKAVTVTANWSKTKYMLSIDPNGGTYNNSENISTVSLEENEIYSLEEPTREGYDFTGWTSSEEDVLDNNIITMPNKTVTVTANWVKTKYTLTIKSDGGTYNGSTEDTIVLLEAGETYTLSKPTKTGYTFSKWTSSESGVLSGSTVTMPNKAVTVTASWTKTKYTLTINPKGGSYNNTTGETKVKLEMGQTYILNDATRDYYEFGGWSSNVANTLNDNVITMPASNVTVNASWNCISNTSVAEGYKCKRAAICSLHTDTCQWSYDYYPNFCTNGTNPIVYGNRTVTDETLNVGDAFDCDVNGDGIYNPTNERFYYLGTKDNGVTSEDTFALMIYYSDTVNGIASSTALRWSSNDYSSSGPTVLRDNLPTTSQWRNIELSQTKRDITDEKNAIKITDFSYEGYAARLATYQEVYNNCYSNTSYWDIEIDNKCTFLYENSQYASNRTSTGPWLETISTNNVYSAWRVQSKFHYLQSWTVNSAYAGARPVIEILPSEIEGLVSYKTLIIDPNGGTYDNSTNVTYVNLQPGETHSLLIPTRDEYEFDSWTTDTNNSLNDNIVTMPNKTMKVKANWKTQILINTDGGSYNGVNGNSFVYVKPGNSYTLDTPTKEGYTFDGWQTDQTGVLSGNVVTVQDKKITVTAKWKKNKYTLTIDPNGGTYNGSTEPVVVELETGDIYTLDIPEKKGYVLHEWSSEQTLSVIGNTVVIIASNVTVTAQWGIPLCKRADPTTLHMEKCMQSDSTKYCSLDGYSLYDTIIYGNETTTSGVLNTGDAFDCDINGDNFYDPETERFYYVSTKDNSKGTDDNIAVLVYYTNTINGVISRNSSNLLNINNNLPSVSQWSNVFLTENYDHNESAARLLFDKEVTNGCYDGVTHVASDKGLSSKCKFLMENTTYSDMVNTTVGIWLENGYGAYTSVMKIGKVNTSYTYGVRPTIEVPFNKIELLTPNILTIDPNGGLYNNSTDLIKENLEENETYTLLTPTREGYTFTGWISSEDGALNNNIVTMPKKSIRVTAQWKKVKYSLTINPNGGVYNNSSSSTIIDLEENQVFTLNTPVKQGYSFIGWTSSEENVLSDSVLTMPNKSVTLTANWEVAQYTVIIDPNGGLYNGSSSRVTEIHETGYVINLSNPTRENYTFTGWLSSDENALSNDVVTVLFGNILLTAQWTYNGSGDNPDNPENAVARIERTGVNYTTIQAAINEALDSDTITILANTNEDFSNSKQITLDINQFDIIGKLTNTGNITLINGTLENIDDYAIDNTGILSLGLNDEEVSQDSIIIKTDVNHNVIYQQGTLNFYDGYIEGKIALNGPANEKPDGYVVYVEHRTSGNLSYQNAHLSEETTARLNAVAKTIVGTEVLYYDLQDAIDTSVETGYEIYAIRDFQASYELNVPSSSNNNIVFDIDGYNIEMGNSVINNKNFTLKNGKNTGNIKIASTIQNYGTLNIEDIDIITTTNVNAIDLTGTLNIKNSSVRAKDGYAVNISGSNNSVMFDDDTYLYSNQYAMINGANELLTINKGTIYGIKNDRNKELYIGNDVQIYNTSSSNSGIYNQGILTFYGKASSTYYSIYNISGTIYFYGIISDSVAGILQKYGTGTYNGEIYTSVGNGININDGTAVINGGIIESNSYGITNGGTLTINDGYIKSYDGEAIYSSSQLIINNGYIEGAKSGIEGSGIIVNNGTIKGNYYGISLPNWNSGATVLGGTVIGGVYGIYASQNTSPVIGTNDNNINNVPTIQGDLYGVYIDDENYKDAGIIFYDGILKGKTNGYYGLMKENPDGYAVYDDEEVIDGEEYRISYLDVKVDFLEVEFAPDDVRRYNSFNTALNDIENNTSTVLKVINDATIKSPVSIGNSKKITIDVNGHSLEFSKTITNNGTLEILDNSIDKNGLLYSPIGILINNSGNLTINDIKLTSDISENATTRYLITNTGTLYFNGTLETNLGGITNNGSLISNGIVKSLKSRYENYAINSTSGSLTINGGTIIGKYYTIYAKDITATINDGTIIGNGDSSIAIMVNGNTNFTINKAQIYGTNYGISISSSSTLTLGQDDGIIDNDNIIVKGENYGINANSSKFNYYDGIIIGSEFGYAGSIYSMPDSTFIADEQEVINDVSYHKNHLEMNEFFLQIGDKKYASFDSALEDVPDNSEVPTTIKVIASKNSYDDTDISVKLNLIISASKNIIIDMNNNTLYFEQQITNNGNLQIVDNSESKNGTIITNIYTKDYLITNNSNLTINDVKIIREHDQGEAILNNRNGYLIFNGYIRGNGIYNYGKLDFTGKIDAIGMHLGITSIDSYAIINFNGEIIMADPEQEVSGYGQYYALDLERRSNTVINGGKIIAPLSAIYVNYGTVTINDGYFESKIIKYDSTTYKLSAAVEAKYDSTSTITINNGTFKSNNCALYNSGDSSVTINNGRFEGKYAAITTKSSTINGGTFIGETYGLLFNVNKGVNVITNGTIIGGTYGINLNSNTEVIIGVKDNVIDDSILIQGGTYGINAIHDSKTSFYDGLLKGKTAGYSGGIYDTSENCYVATRIETDENDPDNPYIVNYLDYETEVVTDGINNYTSIQSAIDSENTVNGTTLTLLRDAEAYYAITINKDITLDLNGYNLYTPQSIENTANSKIYSSTTRSRLYTAVYNNIIVNNGILELDNLEFLNHDISLPCISNNATINANNIFIDYYNGTYVGFSNGTESSVFTIEDSDINASIGNSGTMNLNNSTFNYITNYKDLNTNNIEANYISFVTNPNNHSSNSIINDSKIDDISTGRSTTIHINNSELYETENKGNLIISDSVVNTAMINREYGRLELNNVTVNMNYNSYSSGSRYGIKDESRSFYGGALICHTCNINVSTSCGTVYGIYKIYESNMELEDANINVTNSYYNSTNYGIYMTKGVGVYKSGTLNVSGGKTTYGLYLNSNTELTLGEAEDPDNPNYGTENANVSVTSPYIKAIGSQTGIAVKNNNAKFNFYDGILIGSSAAKPEIATNVEYHYEAFLPENEPTNSDGYKTNYLYYLTD